ncbi:hypothetical protein GA0061099_104214 [Bradyrhizobium yuanmingense]|uniref:Uncharacterized protein n=1 Tax=Bradyrhizobium yuanmingense TaxID=108015 RepID=A0A1C3XLG8_9BRAD|nr:hypothetical protein IQ15_07662 [Bradyrhizobium yuanmingense]SCB52896.1 hypothetical protein GA0061099_104214 [Bradyrhizobium yuanmingense]
MAAQELCRSRPGRVVARYPRRAGTPRGARDTQPIVNPVAASKSIDLFLASLRTPWNDGAMRPTGSASRESEDRPAPPDPLIRACQVCENGLKSTPGGLAANCSPGCRSNILEPIRTSFLERFNVGSNPGAASKRTRYCSFLRRQRFRGMRPQHPNDVPGAQRRRPGAPKPWPSPHPASSSTKPGAK